MRAWRIVKSTHAAFALSGEGARLYGGRFNSPGTPVVYASSSLALAALEILAGLEDYALLRECYSVVALTFRADMVEELPLGDLPPDWLRVEHPELKRIGDAWAASKRSLVLRVPSAIIPSERNFLVNPLHPDFPKIKASPPAPFPFDPRLIK